MPKVDLTTWQNLENALRSGAAVIHELLDEVVAGWPGQGQGMPSYPFGEEREAAELMESLAEEVKDYEDNQARLAEEREARGFQESVQKEGNSRERAW